MMQLSACLGDVLLGRGDVWLMQACFRAWGADASRRVVASKWWSEGLEKSTFLVINLQSTLLLCDVVASWHAHATARSRIRRGARASDAAMSLLARLTGDG